MRGRGSWGWAVPVIAALAGLLFATSGVMARGSDLRASGVADLADVIRERTQVVAERARAVGELREQVEALDADGADPALVRLRERRSALVGPAGASPVEGPALTVRLDDAHLPGELPEGLGPNDVVVHEQDVQGVVNALWAAGAEAMTIQDQRVIATSAIRCVGNTLILQGRVYSPPFSITAIGDVRALRSGLDQDRVVSTYREWVARAGLGYEVIDAGSIRMPAFDGLPDLTHARAER